jgi:hypothetical protein
MSQGTEQLIQNAIDGFVPRRVRLPEILVAGKKVKRKALQRLGLTVPLADAMPDLVIHDLGRDWLFLMDVASPFRRMDKLRRDELRELFEPCDRHLVLFSVFPDMESYALDAKLIACGTHAWIANMPKHMIHHSDRPILEPYPR